MTMNRIGKLASILAVTSGLVAAQTGCSNGQQGQAGAAGAGQEKVALLVTGWGTPETAMVDYAESIRQRAIIGERATSPDQPCSGDFVGTFPFRSEKGLLPYVVAFKTKGFEQVWDGSGIYRRNPQDGTYVSIVDPDLIMTADQAEAAGIARVKSNGIGMNAGAFGPDPRNGADYLADIVRTGQPNGLHDVREMAMARFIWMNRMMGLDPNAPPRHDRATLDIEAGISQYIHSYYGDRVALRFGYYAAIPGISERHDETAVALAQAGYRRLVLARETTDHNNYANNFMDLYPVKKALCQAGFTEQDVMIEPVRQVGRTPEYNAMIVDFLRPYLAGIETGREVSIVYTTWGLPWPGRDPAPAPFSSPQPSIKEVYNENAFLNFLSLKPYLLQAFDKQYGGEYRLNFAKSGGTGGDHSRTNSLFAYGKSPSSQLGHPDDPLRYTTIRENLEQAIRLDGRKEIIVLLSHWYNNSSQTAIEIRMVNDLPLNSIEEMHSEIYSRSWCERYTGPGEYQQITDPGVECPAGYSRVQITEAFNDVMDDFTLGYANRIRGGIERFGVFPDLDIDVVATAAVKKTDGGVVEVNEGPLRGARLVVPADPRPGEPESYQWANRFRPESDNDPNTGPDAVRAINTYTGYSDYLDGAKDDFMAYIGTQALAGTDKPLPLPAKAVSKVILFGPYRTLFNAPARVSLPYDPGLVANPAEIRPYIYNELTQRYDPVYRIAGGEPVRIDPAAATVSFDVQVLGNFVLIAE